MSTRAVGPMKQLCDGIEKIFPSAVFSGIVGDRRHRLNKIGTYHLSREDVRPGTYSVIRPDDKAGQGPDDSAAGFDISMNRADMVKATTRLERLWANTKDPRRKYLNAFNGWLGKGDATRFDIVKRVKKRATPDHRSHVHGEVRRRYVMSGVMVHAVLSAFRGESPATYLQSIGVTPAKTGTKLAAPKYPGRVLKAGNSKPDAAVKAWQVRMSARGWKSIGKADGLFGAKTTSVVKRFQKECRVPVDGHIGPATWPLPWTRPLGG